MPDTLNDASVVAGGRQITIGAVTYDATNFNWDETDVKVTRKGIVGQTTGRKLVNSQEQTFTATFQLPSTTAVLPPLRTTFTTTDLDGNSVTCYLEKRGRAETNGGETTVPVSGCKAIGSIVTS